MRIMVALITGALTVLGFLAEAEAAVSSAATFTAVRAPHPIPLDASLSDPAWALGWIEPRGFWDITKRNAAPLDTRVSLLYDDTHLYVGFHVEQPGLSIIASQSTNDVGFGLDDFVGVAIDASGAGNRVYFFETTPRGVHYQQASENVRYAARWQSAAKIDGQMWNAVLVIPLSAMRTSPSKGTTWRINFIRSIAALGEHYTWAYDGLMTDGPVGQAWPSFGDARYWPSIKVNDPIGAGQTLRPKPRAAVYALGTAGSDRDLFQQADGSFDPQRVRPTGADVTVPLTETINMVGTVDPDFSNVEVDQQTIVPQEFPRQLQEYRPFFAQGATFLTPNAVSFSSPTGPNMQTFYSPRIGPFDRGAKVEGSFGSQSFGAMNFRGFDETSGNTFDDIAYGYRHALPDQSFLYWADGVDAHHSIAGDDATTDVGESGRNPKSGFQWGNTEQVEQGSWVPDPGIAHWSNTYVGLFKTNTTSVVGYNDVGPNFNPIDGLTFNSDVRGFQGFEGTSGSTKWAKNYALGFNWDRWFDKSGAVHEEDTLTNLTAAFNNGFSIDALGPSLGTLREYDMPAGDDCAGTTISVSSFTGFPCYRNGRDERFDLFQTAVGYRDGTPKPTDLSVSEGPFGSDFVHVFSLTTSRPLGRFTLGAEYDGTDERSFATGDLDSQWLRRISLGASLGSDSNLSMALRSVNGLGGFAPSAGTNLVLAYHRRFSSGDELYVDYGAAAASSTLHRLILKYVLQFGGDAGT